MKELQHVGGTFVVDDRVADAIEKLAATLVETGMSATIHIRSTETSVAIEMDMGHDRASGLNHVLHAIPATGKGSHLDIEEV